MWRDRVEENVGKVVGSGVVRGVGEEEKAVGRKDVVWWLWRWWWRCCGITILESNGVGVKLDWNVNDDVEYWAVGRWIGEWEEVWSDDDDGDDDNGEDDMMDENWSICCLKTICFVLIVHGVVVWMERRCNLRRCDDLDCCFLCEVVVGRWGLGDDLDFEMERFIL